MSGTIDFTQGKVSRAILRFFFPMLATGMLQQFYTFADTAIVGWGLGDNALAAVGNMGSLCFLIVGFSMGLASGFSVLMAQRFGEKDFPELRKTMSAIIRLAVIITVGLTAISVVFLKTILILIQTDEKIIGDSLIYGYIVFGGLFSSIFFNMGAAILRALGDSKTPLKAIVISSVLNILLDCVFIFVLHTGVWGAAVATVISQVVSGTVCLLKIKRIEFLKKESEDPKPERKIYELLMKNGLPMALMNSVTAVGCIAVQYYVNGLGVAFTSAYSACSKYINIFIQPAATAGLTMSAYTGQNYGAKKFDRIKEGLKVCLFIAVITYVLLGAVMTFFPGWLASLLLSGKEQIANAVEYLPICGVMMFAVDLLFVYRNAVQGMGFPLIPMISGIVEMVFRIGMISLLIGFLGFRATAVAEACAWTGAMILNAVAFYVLFVKERRKANE